MKKKVDIIISNSLSGIGSIGDVKKVSAGYMRNWLMPNGYAIYATKDNIADFNKRKDALKQEHEETIAAAHVTQGVLNDTMHVILRETQSRGKIFGSVSRGDIKSVLPEGTVADPAQIVLDIKIKERGIYKIRVNLYNDISAVVYINVASSEEEAATAWENMIKENMPKSSKTHTGNLPKDKLNKDHQSTKKTKDASANKDEATTEKPKGSSKNKDNTIVDKSKSSEEIQGTN